MVKRKGNAFNYRNTPYKKPRSAAQTFTVGRSNRAIARRNAIWNMPEKKYHHKGGNGNIATIASGTTTLPLCELGNSSTVSGRIGNKVKGKYVRIRLALDNYNTNFTSPFRGRVAVVVDKSANGVTGITPDEVYEQTTGGAWQYMAYRKPDNLDRFVVLKEKDFTFLPCPDASAYTDDSRIVYGKDMLFDWFVPIPEHLSTITYKDTTLTPNTNAIWLVIYGMANGIIDQPNYAVQATFCYTE